MASEKFVDLPPGIARQLITYHAEIELISSENTGELRVLSLQGKQLENQPTYDLRASDLAITMAILSNFAIKKEEMVDGRLHRTGQLSGGKLP